MFVKSMIGVDGNEYAAATCPKCGETFYSRIYGNEPLFEAIRRDFDMAGKTLICCRYCGNISELRQEAIK